MAHLEENQQIALVYNREGQDGLTTDEFRSFLFEQINTIASMVMNVQTSQIFNDTTYEIISGFDAVTIQNDLIVADPLTNTHTVLEDAIYQLNGGLSLDFPTGELLGVMWFVNNIIINPNPVQLRGEGINSPITTSWEAVVTLNKNDVVTMKAININVGNLNADMKAMFFTVKRIG